MVATVVKETNVLPSLAIATVVKETMPRSHMLKMATVQNAATFSTRAA